MKQIPQKFGQISIKILKAAIRACPIAKTVCLIFNTYQKPSLKDTEHNYRNNFSREFFITGNNQRVRCARVYIMTKSARKNINAP